MCQAFHAIPGFGVQPQIFPQNSKATKNIKKGLCWLTEREEDVYLLLHLAFFKPFLIGNLAMR